MEEALRPRWTWWSSETAEILLARGIRVSRCWDIAAAHRLLFGGWKADAALVWARLNDLAPETIPNPKSLDLFNYADDEGDLDEPVGSDGHLRPEWVLGGWSKFIGATRQVGPDGFHRFTTTTGQARRTGQSPTRAIATVRSESAAELLCVELAADGLPMDHLVAEQIIEGLVGPRTSTEAEATVSELDATPKCCATHREPIMSIFGVLRRFARCYEASDWTYQTLVRGDYERFETLTLLWTLF